MKAEELLPKKYLREGPITIEEAEARNMFESPALGPNPVPFGFLNSEWRKMKAKMREGDELREFQTKVCEGIALLRNARIIDFIGVRNLPPDIRHNRTPD